MSQPVLNITRMYTTKNGRQGVCYTLRGARAASFVPSGCEDVLGWLLSSLNMGVEMSDTVAEKIERLTIEVRHSSRKNAWCKEIMGLTLKPGGYERFQYGDYLKASRYPKGYREYALSTATDSNVRGWITSDGSVYVVTAQGIEQLDEDALFEACKPSSIDQVWGDIRAEMQEGDSKAAMTIAERALLFEGGEDVQRDMIAYIHGNQTGGLDLAALKGSAKQISWANDIRLDALEWAAKNREEWEEELEREETGEEQIVRAIALDMCDELDEILARITSAKLYIDTRHTWHGGWGMDEVAKFMATTKGERTRTVSFSREVYRRAKVRMEEGSK